MGSVYYPLSLQIADTIREHGADWAEFHYCYFRRGPKLSRFEWSILSRAI